ncbi:MAG: HepT-like ribonuclease domain-containing protein, partial [Thermodesulfobacteriota bacterium]
MSKRTDKEYLLDIREAIKRIELYTENLDYQNFLKDIKTQDAVLRNIEIIG